MTTIEKEVEKRTRRGRGVTSEGHESGTRRREEMCVSEGLKIYGGDTIDEGLNMEEGSRDKT